jgi:dTDP-glucose 4,6-dehydratase
VEDHCRAIESIILKGKTGETYCVGGNSELTNHELVKKMLGLMADITGKRFTMESHVSLVKDRPGHDRRYAMDISKINRELGWSPRHSFETGFRATVEWYMSETGRAWLSAQEKSTADVRDGQGKKLE